VEYDRSSGGFGQATQARGRSLTIQLRRCNVENQSFPGIDLSRRLEWGGRKPIRFQEDEAGRERGSLVAVDESMIATEVEEIRRRDLDAIGDQRLPAERCLRGSNGGLEKRHVPNARGTTVRLQDLTVNSQHRFR
jgi:hypothetical protein